MLTAAVLSDIETNLNYKQRQVPATHPLITDLQNYQLGWKQSIWRETGTVILVNYHHSLCCMFPSYHYWLHIRYCKYVVCSLYWEYYLPVDNLPHNAADCWLVQHVFIILTLCPAIKQARNMWLMQNINPHHLTRTLQQKLQSSKLVYLKRAKY